MSLAAYRAWRDLDPQGPPPGATTELGQLLWTIPRPLINPQARLILIFSHKSACTSAVIWFWHHLGYAKAAHDYQVWPHEYRDNVYYYSQAYRDAYALDLTKFLVVRVVRDPWDRAVSSFRHALEWDYIDAPAAKLLGRRDVAANGLSFAEFLDLLERSDIATCDPHYRLQRHPIEDVLPVHYLINVTTENLFTRFNAIEAGLGLPRTDMAKMPWIQELATHHRPQGGISDEAGAYTRRLSKAEARDGPWPPYEALLTDEARARIAKIYAADIAAYVNQSAAPLKAGT